MDKKKLVIIFGGRSSEHEVSCISVQTVAGAVDAEKYQVTLVGITTEGRWLKAESLADVKSGEWVNSKTEAVILPDASRRIMMKTGDDISFENVDVIFPVLHGMYGEDGTIQGLFEMADIPYVGCGVFASAAAMDKLHTKVVAATTGVAQAAFVPVFDSDFTDLGAAMDRVENEIPYPVFVKPAKAGSSKGVNKATNRNELEAALNEAIKHDKKILVEETIVGRELECAVLGFGRGTEASGIGEILAGADFYDYDAKYHNAESQTIIGADISDEKAEEIQEAAKRIYTALDGFGLSRVDFFLENGTDRVVFNEINTLPGFTSISMYPMLMNAKGYHIQTLVETLIEMAKKR